MAKRADHPLEVSAAAAASFSSLASALKAAVSTAASPLETVASVVISVPPGLRRGSCKAFAEGAPPSELVPTGAAVGVATGAAPLSFLGALGKTTSSLKLANKAPKLSSKSEKATARR